MNKANGKIYGLLALLLYIGAMVGLGFILDLFWKVSEQNITMFWITTAIVCVFVSFYVVLLLFGKKDQGVGAIQLFLSILLSALPIVVRLINMIPGAGIYISIILVFILGVVYLGSMIAMGYYASSSNNGPTNRAGGKEI